MGHEACTPTAIVVATYAEKRLLSTIGKSELKDMPVKNRFTFMGLRMATATGAVGVVAV
ncbi:hypothetical protein SEA_HEXBUG_65 [Gordonia phage Hexbug]|nr:hypothetical protein SEA_HEXBUG_65 [Gordonia phage Hexbug]